MYVDAPEHMCTASPRYLTPGTPQAWKYPQWQLSLPSEDKPENNPAKAQEVGSGSLWQGILGAGLEQGRWKKARALGSHVSLT